MIALRGFLFFIVVTLSLFINTEQRGTGAPSAACAELLPKHDSPAILPQTSATPYTLTTSTMQVTQGTTMNVTLSSPVSSPISGFLMQARNTMNSSETVGSWTGLPELTKTSDCQKPFDSVTHKSTATKANLIFTWTAPANFIGSVVFRATVAENYSTFWAGHVTPIVNVVKA